MFLACTSKRKSGWKYLSAHESVRACVRMRVCVCARAHARVRVCVCVCARALLLLHLCVCTCVCARACACVCMCVHGYVCACTRARTESRWRGKAWRSTSIRDGKTNFYFIYIFLKDVSLCAGDHPVNDDGEEEEDL